MASEPISRMTSLSLATLIVDALVDAKFVGKSDLDAAVRRTKATLISRRTKNLLCSCFSAIPSSRVLRHLKSLDKFAGKATFCYKLNRCSKGS